MSGGESDALRERIAELTEQASRDRREIATLRDGLATARRIGAAVGVIMVLETVSDVEAFGMLRASSQSTNRKLRDVAEDVLAGFAGSRLGPSSSAAPALDAPGQRDAVALD